MKELICISLVVVLVGCSKSVPSAYTGYVSLLDTKVTAKNDVIRMKIEEYNKDSLGTDILKYNWSYLNPSRLFVSELDYRVALEELIQMGEGRMNIDSLSFLDDLYSSLEKAYIPRIFYLDTACVLNFYERFLNDECYELKYSCYSENSFSFKEILRPNSIYRVGFSFDSDKSIYYSHPVNKYSQKEYVFIYTDDVGEISKTRYSYYKHSYLKKRKPRL